MQKFLVIQTAFIGDVVLATGLIEKLHARFPQASIDFMVRKGNEGLLTGHPLLHEVLIWDKKQNKIKNLFKLLRKIRKEKYDKVINLQRFAATGILTALSGAKETIGFDKNPLSFLFSKKIPHIIADKGVSIHEVERNNQLVKHFTDDEVMMPKLYPSAADHAAVQQYQSQPYICIAPASVWFTKQYPADKWVSFINKVPPSLTIYLIGAPGDNNLCESIRSSAFVRSPSDTVRSPSDTRPSVINLAGKLSFLQSAALQKGAVMNYVNDSAPMHFASAVNAATTAVYCSTLPSFGFGPLSTKKFIVEKTEPLYCRPCGLHGRAQCPEGHFRCAYDIRDEQLLEVGGWRLEVGG
jgi:ADP-heptose:LPS heptosyltransferase